MNININAKTDYSFLFSSLNTSSGIGGSSTMSSFLSDYASIKNGSYGKLMKAYFSQNSSSEVKSLAGNSLTAKNAVTSEDARKLNKVQTTTDDLKEAADALLKTGSKSVFAQKDVTTTDENGLETTGRSYDVDAIYGAVSDFVTKYNAVISAVDDADVDTVTSRAQNMVNQTSYNETALNKIGITMKDDGTLSLDKETFVKADMSSVKSLFNGTGSYGYQVSAQASMTNYAADRAASKAATYTGTGNYSTVLSSGNIFNSYF